MRNGSSFQDVLRSFDLSALNDGALALGYISGKVRLSKAVADPDIKHLKNSAELISDIPKPVIFLNYSPVTEEHLAACFEGGRSQDYTACVYDINRPKPRVFCWNSAESVADSTWFKYDFAFQQYVVH
ncbi:unnamed protein product [Gongylonema pulchrum]|uniref:WD_REPEATS_REGION domain-containing protein n=1 Tax=Gongylonema pulchrum TaxID=637853 RepID=A0A183ET32_9BILA|nr:unnamed protein product [Gongylonema pulchrum]